MHQNSIVNNDLNQIPKSKQEELTKIAQLLSEFQEVELVILFGSYARGNWGEDKYIEKEVAYEYRSDYDLLVVLKQEDLKQKFRIEGEVKNKLIQPGEVTTPVIMIFHGIKHLNEALTIGNSFFKDIKKGGIVLYDSKKFTLAVLKELTAKEYQKKAQGYFDQWVESANGFYKTFGFNFKENDYNLAAFQLHQATERYYTTILLVLTDYRPKEHNLETLGIKAEMCDQNFAVLPQNSDEEKRLFELLKKAYIDARGTNLYS